MTDAGGSYAVVIPAFDAEATIRRAITSAFGAGAHRVIVVDDGSSDGTADAARRAGAEVVEQENSGASAARSAGADLVREEYVTFLDADDEVIAAGVRRSIELLSADPRLAVAAGRVIGFVGDGEGSLLPQTYTDVTTETLLTVGYGPWPPGAAVLRTRALRVSSSLDPAALRPRYAEDYELLIRLSLAGEIVRHDLPSMRYEMAGGKSARSAISALRAKEAIRAHYADSLGIKIEMMRPMRMRAAANKRVARARGLAGDSVGSARAMAVAYVQGLLSLIVSR
ncbi:glycosyltransferase family 2 protein [Microbacterium sp. NPDC055683]